MSGISYVRDILGLHYAEAADGLVDKAPSRLSRGEGAERDYFIMKIDLVRSTQILFRKNKSTYLKLAHTFLSTIDKVTQDCGADPEQTEYAGDSVLAYFPESESTAEDVMRAASYSRAAVLEIQRLDETLKNLQIKCKIVLHFDTLIVAKIGPRANSFITAIGMPLHRVAKLEKEIVEDTGRATEKFFNKVSRENRKYLYPVYEEKQVPIPAVSHQVFNHQSLGLASLLNPKSIQPSPLASSQYRTEKSIIGYNLKWHQLFRDLKLIAS